MSTQLAFDLDAMIHELDLATLPTWEGAPLHFTADYYDVDELGAATERWRFIHNTERGYDARAYLWIAQPWHFGADGNGHTFDMVSADLRCNVNDHRGVNCECLGDLMYQTICSACAVHFIAANENEAVEAWHDHAWPGWRDLPALPAKLATQGTNGKWSPRTVSWWQDNYPLDFQTEGAPIITTRNGIGTRHVPGRAMSGGYDLGRLDPTENV